MELAVTTVPSVTNPDVGDLMLGEDGREVVRTELSDEVHQRLMVRFNFFKGEWFLDLDAGCPYYQYLLKKNPSDRVIRTIFAQVITGTLGVSELTSFGYSIAKATRALTLTFKCRLEDGSTFSSSSYPPYVIAV